jgi:hypothetical protein
LIYDKDFGSFGRRVAAHVISTLLQTCSHMSGDRSVSGGGPGCQGPGRALFCLDLHDDATVDLVVAHAIEDAVDVFQPLGRVVDLHLAVGGKLQALGEIEPRPNIDPRMVLRIRTVLKISSSTRD